MTKTFYITTPIYYVNDVPHIGHAYTSLACDVLARFMRLDGYDVHFLTGTDEHGQKVEKSAAAKGVAPQAFTDEVSQHFRNLTQKMQFSNNDFIRTTEARHKQGAQAFWKRLEENGYIYLDKYAGWYSVRDEAFYMEDDLVDGKAPTGAPVEWVEEESYFFKLSAFQDILLKFYDENPEFILPKSRYNEVVSFVKSGLKDLSISRTTFKWGIPVPGNERHVMYVWLDALANYITALGFPDETKALYQKFWVEGELSPIHIVGKDILRFHAVYWPAFLMAAKLPLPKRIVAHGWWTNEGQKISKSIGNVIDPNALVDEFGLDQVRYFLMREVPFGNDGNYSREGMVNRINSDLANNIGNLAQRTLSMIQKNCGGNVPAWQPTAEDKNTDLALMGKGYNRAEDMEVPEEVYAAMCVQKFDTALAAIVKLADQANLYIDAQAPWKLKKENPKRMEEVLYTLAETIRCIGILLQPFMPHSAAKMLDQLAIPEGERLLLHLVPDYALKSGTALPAPEGIFPRFVEEGEQKIRGAV